MLGNNVFFLTGADENAIKVVEAAEQAGMQIKEFINEKAGQFLELKNTLNLSWDDFIRTTEPRHIEGVKKFWEIADQKGNFYKKSYAGLYCVGCERFYEPAELDKDGNCPDHKRRPDKIEEENYFFKLSRYQKDLERIFYERAIEIIPAKRAAEMKHFIKEGLKDFSASRPASRTKNWGIGVPNDPNQKIYVWIDALTNYINAIGYSDGTPQFKTFWEEADDIIHFIGKDIARFHAIYWPAMLLSARLRLPTKLFIHGHITVNGQKMSKSIGNVAYPETLTAKYGIDAVRYFLLREISSVEDGDFSEEKLLNRYNGDLANGLGNLVSRVAALASKLGEFSLSEPKEFKPEIEKVKKEYWEAMESLNFHAALEKVWELLKAGDVYINEKKPWEINPFDKLRTGNEIELARILNEPIHLILHAAWLLQPFLPETSEKIFAVFGITASTPDSWNRKESKIKTVQALFPRQ